MAVKPQQMREAAAALAPFIADVPVVLSIAAGTRIADLSRWLGGYPRIVRAMPNTPALVGAGISGVSRRVDVDAASRKLAGRVLEAAGAVLWVRARGHARRGHRACPAAARRTCSIFSKRWSRRRASSGFAGADARKLAYATFAGAIKLAQASDLEPAILRAQVTSKGGTTERALGDDGGRRRQGAIRRRGQGGRGARARTGRRARQGCRVDRRWPTRSIRYLLDVVFGLFTYALLLRFAMQVLRAPFRNPLGQAVIALTDWIVKPLRRVLPGWKGIDWASLVATFLFQFLWLLAYALVFGGFSLLGVGIAFLLAATVIALVKAVLWLLIVVVLVQAILSWVAPDGPLSGLLNALTFPFLRPIRKVLPPIGGTLDLSPLVVIVIAQLLLMTAVPLLESSLTAVFL